MKDLVSLEKGMLISTDICWYVVVCIGFNSDNKKEYIRCVCDNANNIYSFELEEIHSYLTLKEVAEISFNRTNWPKRDFPDYLKERDIPYEVIVEVIAGKHDERWD